MLPERARAGVIAAVLCGLVLWTGVLHLGVRNPDAGVVERMGEVATWLPPRGSLGFVSSDPTRQARYAYDALRYAIAPRQLRWLDEPPHPDWLVAEGPVRVGGYQEVRRLGPQLALWKRR